MPSSKPTTVSSEMKNKVWNVSLKSFVLKGLLKKFKEDLQGELEKEEKGMKCDRHCEYKADHVGNLLPARGGISGLYKWLTLSVPVHLSDVCYSAPILIHD